MSDEPEFYSPETGKSLHRVPEGATIPAGMPYGVINASGWHWYDTGKQSDICVKNNSLPRFTYESLRIKPKFELPTTPGAVIIAHCSDDATRRVFLRTVGGMWHDSTDFYRDDEIRDPQPATVTPNGIGVMDETDKRDRVDADDDRWEWDEGIATWVCDDYACGTLAALDAPYGPLRFADEDGSEK